MPVDKKRLQELVGEMRFKTEERRQQFMTGLLEDDDAAQDFVAQRERHSDYTQKTQQLATEKKNLTDRANTEIRKYAEGLAAAEDKIAKIVGDFENEKITRATAEARLQSVKTKYNLDDNDIPAVQVDRRDGSPKPVEHTAIDIEARLQKFQTDLLSTLRKDMLAVPRVGVDQAYIRETHFELTGKKLTRKEEADLIAKAQQNQVTLEDQWRADYDIEKLDRAREVNGEVDRRLKEAEEKRKKDASDAAMRQVTGGGDNPRQLTTSPVIGRQYGKDAGEGQQNGGGQQSQQRQQQQDGGNGNGGNGGNGNGNGGQHSGPKPSGAERAAAKWIGRREQGIGLGKEEPVGAGTRY